MTEWVNIELCPEDLMNEDVELLLYDAIGYHIGSYRKDLNNPNDPPEWLDNSYDDFSCGYASAPLFPTHYSILKEPNQ